jgi:hypothetical protein
MLLLFFLTVHATLYADRYGNREIVLNNRTALLTLPNTTVITDSSDSVNILSALKQLQLQLQQQELVLQQYQQLLLSQQTQLNAVQQRRACAWEGVGCHCLYSNTATDSAVVVGSNCTNGVLYWIRVMDTLVATSFIGCSYFNLSYCTVML